jgi:hypothetical protein
MFEQMLKEKGQMKLYRTEFKKIKPRLTVQAAELERQNVPCTFENMMADLGSKAQG